MKLRPDEITGLIKQQIKDYRSKLELDDVGTVCTVDDQNKHQGKDCNC